MRKTLYKIALLVSGHHDSSSHAHSKGKFLSNTQSTALRQATKCAPTETPRQIRRNMDNLRPEQQIPHELFRSAQRVVHKQRTETLSSYVAGAELDGSNGSMTRYADSIDLSQLAKRHDDPADPYHLKMHEVVCLGAQFHGGVTYMGLTTPHMLLNLGRAIQSEWEVQLQADGSFNFCDRKFGLLSFGVNSLNAKFRQVAISMVPSEHSSAFITTFNGIENGFFRLCDMCLCPAETTCKVCEEVRDIVQNPKVKQAIRLRKLPIVKASCDNSTSFAKFVRHSLPGASLLQCSAHLTGTIFPSSFHHIM